jgi:hypothetical protein
LLSKRYEYFSRSSFLALAIFSLTCATALLRSRALATEHSHGRKGRVFVLMVWDGLRPDLVTAHGTPNLFALSQQGVRFARHHSNFPTVTMVNAAVLATGAPPGVNGLMGNVVYFAPFFPSTDAAGPSTLVAQPLFIEDTKLLMQLNGPAGLDGQLLTATSIGQELEREGGYLAVIGKRGPTFLFDDRVNTVTDGVDSRGLPHRDYLFVSSDLVEPDSMARVLVPQMPGAGGNGIALDDFMTRVAVNYALPRAKIAAEAGRPALVVLWQRNPDASQHRYGLGTAESMKSLAADDANLATLRRAIASLAIEPITDLMVVSDHGFATIAANVDLAHALVQIGLKRSDNSDDVVVAPNGGSDEVILSRVKFPDQAKRREVLRRIVDFAAVQNWCGPIFSRAETSGAPTLDDAPLEGTFSLDQFGLYDRSRSPDLIISFIELPRLDNSSLTGPENPGYLFDARGRHLTRNTSAKLVEPVEGVVYNDFGPYPFGTGLGMHGAAGERELHNFAAALGPDFRRGFIDQMPTGNADVAPTIAQLLGLKFSASQAAGAAHGRLMREALSGAFAGEVPSARQFELRARLVVNQTVVTSVLHLSAVEAENYLDASEVWRAAPAGASQQ